MELEHRSQLGELMASLGLPMTAVEVGVAEGRYSLEMVRWGLTRLYLVDRWESTPTAPGDSASPQDWHDRNLTDCQARLKDYAAMVTFLRGDSVEMSAHVPDASLGLVYLDACHEYGWVCRDIVAWLPKLVSGGILAGHDYFGYPGVKRAVDEFAERKGWPLHFTPDGAPENTGFWVRRD